MERKIQSHGEPLKQVLLYRDDIEQVVEILREVSPNVELSTDEHKFNDVAEWAELKRDYFTNMQIETRDPYVSLNLTERSVFLYIAKNTPESRGAFEKIKHLLMDRKPPIQRLLNFWMPAVVLNLCLWSFVLVPALRATSRWETFTVDAIFMLGCFWWWWSAFQSHTRKFSIIVPKYRVEAPNFWKRNSDKIVIGIISAVFGCLLTLLIKSLTAKGP